MFLWFLVALTKLSRKRSGHPLSREARTNELVQKLNSSNISHLYPARDWPSIVSTNHRYLSSKGRGNLSFSYEGNHSLRTRQQRGKAFLSSLWNYEARRLATLPLLFQRQSGIISGLKRIDLYTSLYLYRSIDIILKSALSSSSRASKRERRSIAWQLVEETSGSNIYIYIYSRIKLDIFLILCEIFFEKFRWISSTFGERSNFTRFINDHLKKIYIFFSFACPSTCFYLSMQVFNLFDLTLLEYIFHYVLNEIV